MTSPRWFAIGFALLFPGLATALTPSPTTFSFQPVAAGNEPVNEPAVTFVGFGVNAPVYDLLGRPVFFGVLQGPGYVASNNTAFLRRSGATFLTEVQEGTDAPGLSGYKFTALFRPVAPDSLDDSFAFKATARNEAQASNRNGIWRRAGAGVSLVAHEGQAVGGLGTIAALGLPVCHNNGRTVLDVYTSSPSREELWLGEGGGLVRIAAAGEPAPGTPYNFRTSGAPNATLNRTGTVVFYWQLDTAGTPTGLWKMEAGTVSALLVPGDSAPDLPPGVTVVSCAGFINEAGHVAVRGTVGGPGIDDSNASCVWVGPPTELRLLARAGNPAPGTTARFAGLTVDGFTDNGLVLLQAALTGPGVTPGLNDRGIWLGGPAGLTKVMRHGDPAPGTEDGVVFGGFPIAMLAESGEVTLHAGLDGPGVVFTENDEGIWSTAGGPLSLVLRLGQLFETTPGVSERITDIREERPGPFAGRPRAHRPDGRFLANLALEDPSSFVSRAAIYEVAPARGPNFTVWKATVFDPADVDTPAAAPDADFDGDGLVNAFEQLFGLDPTVADARAADLVRIESDPPGGIALTFPIVTPQPDVEVGFSITTDGRTWRPAAPGAVTIEAADPGVLLHRAAFGPESLPGPRGLIRITATKP